MTRKTEPTIEELFEALKHHIKADEDEEEDKDIQTEANPYHSSKEDGRFTTRQNADIYSLTKNATSDPERVRMKGGKKAGAKMGMNFGSAQCGRLRIDGTKKPKNRRCYDYPNTYGSKKKVKEGDEKSKPFMKVRISKMNESDALLSQPNEQRQAAKDISKAEPIEVSLDDLIAALQTLFKEEPYNKHIVFKKMKTLGFHHSSELKDYCRSKGLMSQTDFIKLQNAQMRSQKGELYKPKGK